jgi:alpha-beta hydrolase superfamily lysophospholipase
LKGYETDALRHDKISPALYHGMLDAIDYVSERIGRLGHPILIQVGDADKVVSVTAIRETFAKIGSLNKELRVYEGSYHEIFNDLDREKVFRDLDEFLTPIIGTTGNN